MKQFVKRRKVQPIKRPFATYYYDSPEAEPWEHVTRGACSSDRGGVRATMDKVFHEGYAKAYIVDRFTGAIAFTIKRVSTGIDFFYGDADAKRVPHIRRVA